MNYYNKLPRFWWLNPWSHTIRLFNAVRAIKAESDENYEYIKIYSRIIKKLQAERDRAVIKANKYYYKYQDLSDENFIGDTDLNDKI